MRFNDMPNARKATSVMHPALQKCLLFAAHHMEAIQPAIARSFPMAQVPKISTCTCLECTTGMRLVCLVPYQVLRIHEYEWWLVERFNSSGTAPKMTGEHGSGVC